VSKNFHPFCCVIIGAGSLPRQCGDLLLARGHTIAAVVPGDTALRAWAQALHRPICAQMDDLPAFLGDQHIDYLFSISNPAIIPAPLLALPSRLAINYHDAPLPRYAGVHATSWAIMNGESAHGVTWHVMAEQVDSGDVLVQRTVTIDPQDNAFTLNGKCFEAAIAAFADLIDGLARDTITPVPQNLSQRSYFSRLQRPADGGVIDWRQPAEAIDALCRGLTFGPYPNPLTAPKVALGGDLFVVADWEMGDAEAAEPGTLISVAPNALHIATATRPLIIKKVLRLDGTPQAIGDLAQNVGLQAGDPLSGLSSALAERLTSQSRQWIKHEGFWLNRLGDLSLLDLPYLQSGRGAEGAARAETLPLTLPPTTHAFLDTQGWDQAEFLTAIFALYVGRISRSHLFDLAYAPTALTEALAGTMNFFTAHVPLRIQIDAEASFAQFYQHVSGELALARQKGSYTQDLIVRTPALHNAPQVRAFGAGVAVTETTAERPIDLSPGRPLGLWIDAPQSTAQLVFDPAQIDGKTMRRMVGHFQNLLRAIVQSPQQRIADLPLLTAEEGHQLLVEWNDTATDYPKDKCIHQLFEEQVARTPDALAVVMAEDPEERSLRDWEIVSPHLQSPNLPISQSLTYSELNARANQLARHLQSLGVGPETMVGLYLERSLNLIVGLLAILKAGGAYVPIDPAYPQERVAFILADTQAPVLLTQAALLDRVPAHNAQLLLVDSQAVDDRAVDNLSSGAQADSLAYVIYTSGSTGEPNGVLVEHGGLCNSIASDIRTFDIAAGDRMPHVASFSFDAATSHLFMGLCAGATVYLVARPAEWIGARLVQLLQTAAITHAVFPVSILAALPVADLPALKVLGAGGDVCPPEIVARWGKGRRFFNIYGPTEATITTTIVECVANGRKPTIGRPIANLQVYILDRQRQPVPIGVPGELYIGGIGVARGYLNRPELTAERFIPNPYGPGKLYRTGDLARWLPDGTIDFMGRMDTQVKLRGFRIELGEIEAVLAGHPGVAQAVVMVREDQPGERRLAAYVVPSAKAGVADLTPADLRQLLQTRLPDYMVPAAIVLLDALPLTPNGKVDRKALPVPERKWGDRTRRYMEPRSVEEFDLAALWEEVLGVTQVSIDENFFELGGNSILALRLSIKISEKFGKQFQYPTIVEFSPLLQEGGAAQSVRERWVSLLPLQPKGSRPPFYCITPSGHDGIYLYPFARALGEDQPFYALRLPSLSGLVPPPATIEEAATFYFAELKRHQPQGPYHLGGHSYGGIVAFELAQQLHRAGDDVGVVALFDCEPGDYSLVKPLDVVKYIKRFVDYFVDTYGRPGAGEIPIHAAMTLEKLAELSSDEQVTWVYEVLRQTYAPQAENLDEARGMLLSAIAGFQVVYQPAEVTRLPLTFFLAEKLAAEDAQRRIDYWSRLGIADVRRVPGDHESMFTDPDNRLVLARELMDCLQGANSERIGA
jgi:amino acid adenylation domain-containing protein